MFIQYELALKLKEKGFDDPCFALYYANTKDFKVQLEVRDNKDLNSYFIHAKAERLCVAPTHQQVIDWFREKHNIIIQINADCSQLSGQYGFNWWIWNRTNSDEKWSEQTSTPQNCPVGEWSHDDYYKCLNEAISEAVNLI